MPSKLEILQELERRGKLPEQMRPIFEEAKRRGLLKVPGLLGDQFGQQTLSDATTGVGAAIPFSDEIMSAVAAPIDAVVQKVKEGDWAPPGLGDLREAYDKNQDMLHRQRNEASARSPNAYNVGQAGGALATAAPVAAALPASVPGAMATGMATGGLTAAGEGEGLVDRGLRAIKGTAAGGLAGLALGTGGAAIRPSNASKVATGLKHLTGKSAGLAHLLLGLGTHGASAFGSVPVHVGMKIAEALLKRRAGKHAAGKLADPASSPLSTLLLTQGATHSQ